MHSCAIACIIAAACSAAATAASADVRVRVAKAGYNISGTTGAALLEAMDRKGPKHGFLTRAIAQTRYDIKWDIDWKSTGGGCRVGSVGAALDITYTYPHIANRVPAALDRRWASFMKGVRKHEENHGAIAQRMVKAAERAVTGISARNDPGCNKSKTLAKRRIKAIYAEYEAMQARFDEREHRTGGPVEHLVDRLVGDRRG